MPSTETGPTEHHPTSTSQAAIPTAGSLLDRVPVIPVVVVEDLSHAVPVARALAAGGVPVIELTLRTPVALDAVRTIADEVPEVLLGVGTITTPAQAEAAAGAGAQFLVSPGATPGLLAAMRGDRPAVPARHRHGLRGARRRRGGLHRAEVLPRRGLRGCGVPQGGRLGVPAARFCPTGGITAATAGGYLALPNVGCVGGSWLTPADAMAAGDWQRITDLAAATTPLR